MRYALLSSVSAAVQAIKLNPEFRRAKTGSIRVIPAGLLCEFRRFDLSDVNAFVFIRFFLRAK
jgi:hypothetical protein